MEKLQESLFGDRPVAEVLLADVDGEAAGFALFFPTFSSFEGKPGIYLEDLFVHPKFRRKGIAKSLLSRLARLVLERQGSRLTWAVLDWNTPAIDFYQKIGAEQLDHRCLCRVMGNDLVALAEREAKQEIRTPQSEDMASILTVRRRKAMFDDLLDRFHASERALSKAIFRASPALEVVLAESGNQICGMGTFFSNYSTFLTQVGIHLDELLVAADYRRLGFGSSLLTQLAKMAIERDAGRLEWYVCRDDEEAIAFYRHMGAKLLPEWIPNCVSDRALINLARGVL